MKEVLKKLRALEAEMEEAENQSEYWMEEEHLDMEKSDNYEAEADRLYQEVYKMHNQVADFIVNLTSYLKSSSFSSTFSAISFAAYLPITSFIR